MTLAYRLIALTATHKFISNHQLTLASTYESLNPEIRKRQMIICENEPAELPKDVVRSDTRIDDGIDRLNLNLNNILEKFERGQSSDESQPSSAIVIEKPSFDIKKTLMAFETNAVKQPDEDEPRQEKSERRVVKKLTNIGVFQSKSENNSTTTTPIKPLAVRRSDSLMMRLKKYESRISGEQNGRDDSDEDHNNDNDVTKSSSDNNNIGTEAQSMRSARYVPKKLTSLKNQWENGDISRLRRDDDATSDSTTLRSDTGDKLNGNSPLTEKNDELLRIRQIARKKSGDSVSIKNIYENAIKEAQKLKQKPNVITDLSALNGLSTTEIQQQLLQSGKKESLDTSTPNTCNKDHFQLNLRNKANKLKERFEQGLINNSIDGSDVSGEEDEPELSKLERLRQEKLEDLSVFTDGEIKAREARTMFQQIDRRLSSASGSRNYVVPY